MDISVRLFLMFLWSENLGKEQPFLPPVSPVSVAGKSPISFCFSKGATYKFYQKTGENPRTAKQSLYSFVDKQITHKSIKQRCKYPNKSVALELELSIPRNWVNSLHDRNA